VPRTTVLYDGDCRFCRASLALLLAWDRRGRLRPVPLQSEEAEQLLPRLGPDERMASMHAAPENGSPASGGAALPTLLREVPGGAPLAAVAARFPRAAERGYAAVAGNRSVLSKLVPAAVSRRADELVRKRL
jgi:predicted DCC family thiol-disulfide oxidoreductase YuxK